MTEYIRRYPIGFHVGIGGNMTGMGDLMTSLSNHDIGFFLKSADNYGPINEAIERHGANENMTLVFRLAAERNGVRFDVPDYNKTPRDAAIEHWQKTYTHLPPEFKNNAIHRQRVWLEVINEVDKNRAEWLAEFAIEISKLALFGGFRVALFGWSTGEPEPEHWRGSKMREFLRFASQNRTRVAVAVHEYSLHDQIMNGFPYKVGRFADLTEACDESGISPVPYILITEFGWHALSLPDSNDGMPQLHDVADLYYTHGDIVLGAGLWYLGNGYGGIANIAQRYIAPITSAALDFVYNKPVNPDPPATSCNFNDAFTKYHILRPRVLSSEQKDYIDDLMTNGISGTLLGLPSAENVVVGYEGWSHVDAILAIKRAVEANYYDSRLIVVDGYQIGTGLTEQWLQENCPTLGAYAVFLSSEESAFKYTVWPTQYKHVTQTFGVNPDRYRPFGLPGHEGVDIRATLGSKIFCPADGYISQIHNTTSDGHNYGIFIRVRHKDDYETTFAHLLSISETILNGGVGMQVTAGTVLGYADSTGNSSGSHLHMTLKRFGFPYIDEVSFPDPWPYNIHNPVPYLSHLCTTCDWNAGAPAPTGTAKLGLHATADPAMPAGEIALMQTAGIEAIKLLSSIRKEDASALAQAFPQTPFVIRAFVDFGGRVVTPQQFFDWTYPDVREIVSRLGVDRDIWVELHNEPNLYQEGYGSAWASASAFNTWLNSVRALYKVNLGGVRFLYPGLSPGGNVPGVRVDSAEFLSDSIGSAMLCDGVAFHNYWSSFFPVNVAVDQLSQYINMVGNKPVWITEASNNDGSVTPEQKAEEYINYVGILNQRWNNIVGVTYFVASSSNNAWGWGTGSGEVWSGTIIPVIVGSR